MLRVVDTFATVFRPDVKEKMVAANLSTSEKGKDGEYLNSNWNARFVGKCLDAAKQLKEKDRIKIIRGGVRVEPYEDKSGTKRFPVRLIVFEFEVQEKTNSGANQGDNNLPY